MRLLPALFLTVAASAQPRDAVEWAVAAGSRFLQLTEPAIGAYGYARLGEVVCSKDQARGAELIRQSLTSLNLLTLDNFTKPTHPLPVSSYTGLFKLATAAARKCDPALDPSVNLATAQAKMDEERRQANSRLSQARNFTKDNPDRAAQMIDGALSASVPGVLDMSMLGLALSELRDRAPDLTDDLFPQALDFVANAAAPDPSLLMELGKYLFTSPQYAGTEDKLELSEVTQVGNSSIANFSRVRKSTGSDDIQEFIDATIKVITATNDPNYDPVVAYSLASQMLAKAPDYAPDSVDQLQAAMSQLASQTGGQVARVQAAGGGSGAADADAGEGPRRLNRAVAKVLSETGAGHFDEARKLLKAVGDFSVRTQLSRIVDFAEAGALIGKKDIQAAIAVAGSLRPGVKRCLIDCGMEAAMNREAAMAQMQFSAKSTEVLAAEQRAYTWAAIAGSMLKQDAESFFFALGQMTEAMNQAYVNPHQAHFDPKSVRQTYNPRASTSTDASLIVFNRRGLVEVVDSGAGRHNFSLKVPGVPAYRLAEVIRGARDVDPSRIEAIVLGLQNETDRVNGLIALAALRLGIN
jgi:hypothetical protein